MLEKIKNFFKRLFNIKQIKLIEANTSNNTDKQEENSFKGELKLENNEQYRILDLQKKFKSGEIKVEEMEEEDKDALILLYIQNIKEQLKRLSA